MALALREDLACRRNGGFESGTYQLTAAGETSWHGFSSAIVSAAGENGAALKRRSVAPVATAEYPLPATRPANSRLSGVKRAGRCRLEIPAWDRCMHL
jgi:dTDP-4-dehydrorhamnose reductase